MTVEFTLDEIADSLPDLGVAILHLLHAGGNSAVRGDVILQKELFLIGDYIERIGETADFVPHIFGPYSEAAEVALGELVSLGLVRRSGGGYTLTPDGVRVWEKVCSVFNTEESGAIEDFKAFLNDLGVDEVLLFVYITYPEYTHESARLRDILQKRVPLSASLYRKGKVSLEKAAFLAGMDIESYLDYLKRLLQIVNMQQQCLEAEALRGIINESGDASLDYFSSKKNIVKGDLMGLARRGGR